MLTRADLDAIRAIVRDELRALIEAPVQPVAPVASAAQLPPERASEIAELARARWAELRGQEGAAERLAQLDAKRLLRDQNRTWLRRARKFRGLGRFGEVTEHDLYLTLLHHRSQRKP